MTAPVPHTWVDGEFASAAGNLNPGIRDVLLFLLDPPRCSLKQTVVQSLPNNLFTALTFTTEDYDNEPSGMHDPAVNNSRITIRTAGTYLLTGGCSYAGNVTGRRALKWAVSGVDLQGSQVIGPAGAATGLDISARPTYAACSVGDYIQLFAFNESGAALNTTITIPGGASMAARWVGP